jgi:RsiW-degrading membrane proteinase PrsW (M82 family)
MLLITISLFPVIVILIYIYFRDKYEKEPLGLLLKAFIGGIFAAVVTILALAPFDGLFMPTDDVISGALLKSFLYAAIPEELFKFLFLYWIIWKNRNFNEYFDGIVYAVFVSLGFACLENVLYVTEHGVGVGIMRGVLAVPAHALFGVIMGYYLSIARFNNTNTISNLAKSILYAMLAHGIYNFLIFWYADSAGISPSLSLLLVVAFFVFVVLLWRTGFRKIKQHVELSFFRR